MHPPDLEGVFSFPGHVSPQPGERSTDDLLALAKDQRAYDSAVFDEHTPVFFKVEISSDRVDAYFTQMLASSLKNYADDAAAGVSVLTGHDHRSIPFGRSLTGTYSDGRKTGVKRVTSDFYTLRDLTLNGQPTNDLIDAMRGGLVEDASIGFHGGKMLCNICKRDMLRDWDCWHIPGFRYDASKPESHDVVEGGTLCLGGVDGAHLAEYSLVYDGATPGAGLIKARAEVEMGRAKGALVQQIEHLYRTRMPQPVQVLPVQASWTLSGVGGTGVAAGGNSRTSITKDGKERSMGDETVESGQQAREAIVRAISAGGVTLSGTESATNESLATFVNGALATANGEIARLKPLADDGARARGDYIEQALLAGGRAHDASSWKNEEWKARLERWPLEDIIAQKSSWLAIGDKILGTGGRLTTDAPPLAPEGATFTPQGGRALSVDDLDKYARSGR